MTRPTPRERFDRYYDIDDETGCWIWNSTLNSRGYGRLHVNGKGRLAHRWIYEELHGPIPDGLVIDHMCECKPCVNTCGC